MKAFICRLYLHGFLTYSSSVSITSIRGVKYLVYKPAPFIHNYPLMYAFAGLAHGSLASKTWKLRDVLEARVEPPEYRLLYEIAKRMYVYPARPVSLQVTRMLGNVSGEDLVQITPRPKAMYPWHVVHYYFAPGSIFETVVVLYDEDVIIPKTIRLGAKRYAVFTVECHEAERVQTISGPTDPVNLGDVAGWGLHPDSYTVLLETKLGAKHSRDAGVVVRAYYSRQVVQLLRARFSRRDLVEFKLPMPPSGPGQLFAYRG